MQRRLVGAMAVSVALAAGSAACSGSGGTGDGRSMLAITPGGDAGKVRPEDAIVVKAGRGTIQNVTVTNKGNRMDGDTSADRREWRSRWKLDPGTGYQVAATGLDSDGRTYTTTSSFRTAKVKRTLKPALEAPFHKEKVGVGIPIVLRFGKKVRNRAEVERAMEIRASKPAEGAWHWFGDDYTGGDLLVFRTRKHWPANTKVHFTAHLAGVPVARNVYGGKNVSADFRIGDSHVVKASARTHYMSVYKNGKKIRKVPVSMGMGGIEKYTTTNGDHLTMDKGSPVIMDSSTVGCGPGCAGYYRQTVYSAVRISDSGEYAHSAPWSVGSQGNSNVSHGCVNMAPGAAGWFYDFSYRGDPFKITGTSRKLEPTNGWGYWQLGWNDWVKGSALKQSVNVTAAGITPVPAPQ